jgi:hypothetical protein
MTDLTYDPDDGDRRIPLTNDESAWITIERVPKELKDYGQDNFYRLFHEHPEHEEPISYFNHDDGTFTEVASHRWHQSYMNTPPKDPSIRRNYMFSGKDDTPVNQELPEIFAPYYTYMLQKDPRYNQVVINWYGPDNYIPMHHDCESKMVQNHTISMININEPMESPIQSPVRTFKLMALKNAKTVLYKTVNIVLRDGVLITMCGDTQSQYLHGVRKGQASRISVSFRQY